MAHESNKKEGKKSSTTTNYWNWTIGYNGVARVWEPIGTEKTEQAKPTETLGVSCYSLNATIYLTVVWNRFPFSFVSISLFIVLLISFSFLSFFLFLFPVDFLSFKPFQDGSNRWKFSVFWHQVGLIRWNTAIHPVVVSDRCLLISITIASFQFFSIITFIFLSFPESSCRQNGWGIISFWHRVKPTGSHSVPSHRNTWFPLTGNLHLFVRMLFQIKIFPPFSLPPPLFVLLCLSFSSIWLSSLPFVNKWMGTLFAFFFSRFVAI